jgi:hypothetical protein
VASTVCSLGVMAAGEMSTGWLAVGGLQVVNVGRLDRQSLAQAGCPWRVVDLVGVGDLAAWQHGSYCLDPGLCREQRRADGEQIR